METFQVASGKSDRHVFRNLLLSYTIVFLIPLSLMFCVYLVAKDQLVERESDKIQQQLSNGVEHLQYILDGNYERAQAAALSIVQNEEFQTFLRFNETGNGQDRTNSFRIASQLRSLLINNDAISDIVVKFSRDDLNISQNGSISDKDLFQYFFNNPQDTLTQEHWNWLTDGFTLGQTFCSANGSLYFLRSFPVTPRDDVKNRCMVIIRFKARILTDIVEKSEDGFGYAVLDDESGQNLLSSIHADGLAQPPLIHWVLKGPTGQADYLAVSRESTRLRITYVYAVPRETILVQQRLLGLWVRWIFLICAVLGGGLILYFTTRSLDPLKQLLAAVKGHKPNVLSMIDPYCEIRSMLLDAAAQKLLNADLHKEQNLLEKKRVFIEALSDRKTQPELVWQYAQDIGIDVEDGYEYCLLQLTCTDTGDYFEKNTGGLDTAHNAGSPMVLCGEILRNILVETYAATSVHYGSCIVFIMTINASMIDQWNNDLPNTVGQVQTFLRDDYGIDTLVAVSNIHSERGEIKSAFEEATGAMEYLALAGNRMFTRYSQISVHAKETGLGTALMKNEAVMIGCVKTGEFSRARKYLNEIVGTYFLDNPDSAQVLRFRLYGLLNRIFSAVNYIDIPDIYRLIQKVESHGNLLNCGNIVEIQAELNTLFVELERFYTAAEGSMKESFIKDIQSIIDSNYMNPDLNVGLIATMMGKNLDSVSRMFTKATGTGLLDHIHAIRIQKAKGILDGNRSCTVQKVAIMVGYANCESFIRAFKRREGITPGRYKVMVAGS
ncbi:MAG: helix-turn-helix domain-containing protein [Sphaerochaetaceae bacterium]